MENFGQTPKFNVGDFVWFGENLVHAQVKEVSKTGIDMDGFRFRYRILFSNTGFSGTKWEHELNG
jgi:hypothetical protein